MTKTPHQILKEHFGYDTFRGGQEGLINDILSGKDVLGIMPTGAGKSVCFQVPATIMNGVTIVVSPLISLMKDQVQSLNQAGIGAAFINSSLTEGQMQKALTLASQGKYKLVYVAPERLLNYDFIHFATTTTISMLTVDEAHCISQWGQDFRPSYTDIPRFLSQLPVRPIVSAFTATATPIVKEDIISRLQLNEPTILTSGFDRPNLFFEVSRPSSKYKALIDFLQDKKDMTGVIYCSTRAKVEKVCQTLQEDGYKATRYHGGLSDEERRNNQDDFLYDRANIMVATNAFGMGIDKSNVAYVVHFNMPQNIEGYYQEAGRAGRDGADAYCLLLYSGADTFTNRKLIENSREGSTDSDLKKLHQMEAYCNTHLCLRNYILQYFGETPTEDCGKCNNCNTVYQEEDITTEAKKIISCVVRMNERFGINMVIDVLKGSKNDRLLNLGLANLSTYGISDKPDAYLRDAINYLIHEQYLYKTEDKYPVLQLGIKAKAFLKSDETLLMKILAKEEKKRRTKTSKADIEKNAGSVDQGLFAELKALRMKLANEENVPAFVIFSDSSLRDMCIKMPKTTAEFLQVSGVGERKKDKYGDDFLNAIANFERMGG